MNIARQTRTGGRLALFAMLMQLLFAFGHVAFGDGNLPGYHHDGKMTQLVKALLVSDQFRQDKNLQHKEHEHKEGDCAVCWMLGAAGALVLPVIAMGEMLPTPFVLPCPDKTARTPDRNFLQSCKPRGPPLTYHD